MTPAKHAMFAVPGVTDIIFHASDTGVTTELQFHNGIQVEWFNKTLTESTYHAIFIQQGGHSRT